VKNWLICILLCTTPTYSYQYSTQNTKPGFVIPMSFLYALNIVLLYRGIRALQFVWNTSAIQSQTIQKTCKKNNPGGTSGGNYCAPLSNRPNPNKIRCPRTRSAEQAIGKYQKQRSTTLNTLFAYQVWHSLNLITSLLTFVTIGVMPGIAIITLPTYLYEWARLGFSAYKMEETKTAVRTNQPVSLLDIMVLTLSLPLLR
jgi:hypothetical protein